MSQEVWADVAGYSGDYQVSDLGRMRSFKGRTPRILKPYVRPDGYHEYYLSNGSKGVTSVLLHRVVVQTFHTPDPDRPNVNHKNGLPGDNRSVNLEWCTQTENILHAIDTGLKGVGEDSYQSKLNDDVVRFIKSHYKPRCKKFGCGPLGLMFGVHPGTISAIITNRTWKHVS